MKTGKTFLSILKNGLTHERGLCKEVRLTGTDEELDILERFSPDMHDPYYDSELGYNHMYWGSLLPFDRQVGVMTPLRVMIACMCAAVNNEL